MSSLTSTQVIPQNARRAHHPSIALSSEIYCGPLEEDAAACGQSRLQWSMKRSFRMKHVFRRFAAGAATVTGSPWAFLIAVLVILTWAVSGPLFNFSDGWQLTINTGTTIVTFLMVFLIQNTQNRDSVAIQLKLDELLRGVVGARTSLVDLENLSDEDLALLHQQFTRLHLSAAKSEQDAAEKAIVDGRAEMDPS
jgi:low affinity Fe/Cu permease